MIVDLRRVEAGDGDAGKEEIEEPGACVRQFVEHERAAGKLRENGEQAGSGRRLQHEVGRRDRGGGARREAERDRRRELLERLALLGAARMAWGEGPRFSPASAAWRRAMRPWREWPGRICAGTGPSPPRRRHRRSSSPRRLSASEPPKARSIAARKSGRVDAAAAFEIGEEKTRGLGDAGGRCWRGAAGNGAAARAAAVAETFVMEGTSGEQGRIEPRGALSRPHRLKSVPAVLSL